MLRFNWENITKSANYNPFKAIQLLKEYRDRNPILAHKLKSFGGSSFLLASDEVINDKRTDPLYIYQYVTLAAKRDFTLYKLYGIKYLPIGHYPDLNIGSIKPNPLLNVTNNEIYFKYEELKNGSSIRKN